jgi:hypothetical protein
VLIEYTTAHFKTDDCLIEVTSWLGLTVYRQVYMARSITGNTRSLLFENVLHIFKLMQ